MKLFFLNKKGLTLTELIVSSVVVGIVTVGVAAYSSTVKNVQETTATASRLSQQVAAAIHLMRLDISAAGGSLGDPGLRWDKNTPHVALCARTDGYITPLDDSDDNWNCWFQGNGASQPLTRCVDVPIGNLPAGTFAGSNFTSAGCAAAASQLEFFPLEVDLFFNIDPLGGGGTPPFPPYVTINISVLKDNAVTFNPMTNPRASQTTNISLPAHSMF